MVQASCYYIVVLPVVFESVGLCSLAYIPSSTALNTYLSKNASTGDNGIVYCGPTSFLRSYMDFMQC